MRLYIVAKSWNFAHFLRHLTTEAFCDKNLGQIHRALPQGLVSLLSLSMPMPLTNIVIKILM